MIDCSPTTTLDDFREAALIDVADDLDDSTGEITRRDVSYLLLSFVCINLRTVVHVHQTCLSLRYSQHYIVLFEPLRLSTFSSTLVRYLMKCQLFPTFSHASARQTVFRNESGLSNSLDERRVANIVIAKDLNIASSNVQTQALEVCIPPSK